MENQKSENDIRREIAQNEANTVRNTILIIDALCVAVVFLPAVRIYIDRGQADPISDTGSLKLLTKAIDKLIVQTLQTLNATIHAGTLTAWKQGETLGFASLIDKVPQNVLKSLTEAGTFAHRETAAAAFIDRKIRGLNLSERVWRLEKGIKLQIETVLQLSILNGRSATETANDLKLYLKNPDAIFRKVRDAQGKLQMSQAAKFYRPGVGVYRSAYANAMRLSRNEINNAYRRADWEQTQELDFVTGYRIQLSNNHPVTDICDTLKGIYPKYFQWSGWHVQCRCHMIKEIISPSQFVKMERGEFTPTQTKELPEFIKIWTEENKHRFKPGTGTMTGIEWVDNSPELLAMFMNQPV